MSAVWKAFTVLFRQLLGFPLFRGITLFESSYFDDNFTPLGEKGQYQVQTANAVLCPHDLDPWCIGRLLLMVRSQTTTPPTNGSDLDVGGYHY